MIDFKRAYLYTIIMILFTAAGFSAGYIVNSMLNKTLLDWSTLNQAYSILRDHGWKTLPDDPALEYGMIRGMVQAYDDPYTTFVEPIQHELQSDSLEGSFGGIGVRLGRDQEGNMVLFPFPESPADIAGVLENDILLSVDELQVTPETPTETVQAALRGPVGKSVTIKVARPPNLSSFEYKIKRAEIPLPSVTFHIDPDEPRLGVIEANIIAASTPGEIQSAVVDLQSRGAEVFALDLRDNYGGLLDAGIDTTRLFLKEGEIIQQQYRGKEIESFKVEKPGPLAEIPLVVLVNQNTASAAEIIAGVLKAHGRVQLIGTPTYGKDTIQLVFDLKDGSSLHVTAAQWWIPELGHPLAGSGIQPDLNVEATGSDGPDPAIKAAAQLLLGASTSE